MTQKLKRRRTGKKKNSKRIPRLAFEDDNDGALAKERLRQQRMFHMDDSDSQYSSDGSDSEESESSLQSSESESSL